MLPETLAHIFLTIRSFQLSIQKANRHLTNTEFNGHMKDLDSTKTIQIQLTRLIKEEIKDRKKQLT